MTINHFLRHGLLVLFMLLQCMTPLAHAHVNGSHADGHAHLALTDTPWTGKHHHHVDVVQLPHTEQHAAVVCAPPECRGNTLALEDVDAAIRKDAFVLHEDCVVTVNKFYSPPYLPTSYQHPVSQAPPA